jgi:hypothetical protein
MIDYTECQSQEDGLAHGTSPSTDNAVLHFFGCLKFDKRQEFLDGLDDSDRAKQRIIEEQTRILTLRSFFEMEGHNTAAGSLLYRFKMNLRHRFPEDRSKIDPVPDARSGEARQNLRRAEEREKDFILEDLNANLIYFKKKQDGLHMEPHDHQMFLPNKFPDQKIKLSELLRDDSETNPLMWKCEKDMIRYFHLPANNMEWIEVRISLFVVATTDRSSRKQWRDITTKKTLIFQGRIKSLDGQRTILRRGCFFALSIGEGFNTVTDLACPLIPDICVLDVILSQQVHYPLLVKL